MYVYCFSRFQIYFRVKTYKWNCMQPLWFKKFQAGPLTFVLSNDSNLSLFEKKFGHTWSGSTHEKCPEKPLLSYTSLHTDHAFENPLISQFASYVGYSKITIVGVWLVPDSVHSARTSHLAAVACDYK